MIKLDWHAKDTTLLDLFASSYSWEYVTAGHPASFRSLDSFYLAFF